MNWRAGILVAIWFLVGVVIFGITKDWEIVAAIATWLLAGGIVFAIVQVQQMRKSTNAQVAVELFKKLHSKETLEIVSFIYSPKPEDIKNLSDDERRSIYYLLDRFEMLGALVFNGIIDKQLAIEVGAGLRALRCWYKLYKYIREERPNRGYFAEYYEAFARLSLDYFKEAHLEAKFYIKEERKVIDLKNELQKDELRPRSLEEIKRERKVKKEDNGEV